MYVGRSLSFYRAAHRGVFVHPIARCCSANLMSENKFPFEMLATARQAVILCPIKTIHN